jgi:hypothetical protein
VFSGRKAIEITAEGGDFGGIGGALQDAQRGGLGFGAAVAFQDVEQRAAQ